MTSTSPTPSPKGGKMTKPRFNQKHKEILDSFLLGILGVSGRMLYPSRSRFRIAPPLNGKLK